MELTKELRGYTRLDASKYLWTESVTVTPAPADFYLWFLDTEALTIERYRVLLIAAQVPRLRCQPEILSHANGGIAYSAPSSTWDSIGDAMEVVPTWYLLSVWDWDNPWIPYRDDNFFSTEADALAALNEYKAKETA